MKANETSDTRYQFRRKDFHQFKYLTTIEKYADIQTKNSIPSTI